MIDQNKLIEDDTESENQFYDSPVSVSKTEAIAAEIYQPLLHRINKLEEDVAYLKRMAVMAVDRSDDW